MDLSSIYQNLNSTEKSGRYTSKYKSLMWLHWAMAILLTVLYITGLGVAHMYHLHWLSAFLHQSLGMSFLLLLIVRIFVLLQVISSTYLRRLPKISDAWLKTTVFRAMLYFFMLFAPVSGFCLRNFMGVNTTFFGISIPPAFNLDMYKVEFARSSHFWFSYLFLVFIVLHVLSHWKVWRSHWQKIASIRRKIWM